jgi:histidinol-phosphate phosphatase family protein
MSNDKKAAVFLDRDGTIIEDRGHLRSPSEVVFFPEALEVLQELQKRFLLFIVTNQSGIAKGLITQNDVNRVNAHVITTFANEGVEICDVYVCPHGRSDGCRCIKPKPYFLRKAAERYSIVLSASFTVGDHPHDVHLAHSVGARGIYVLTGHGWKHFDELPEDTEIASGMAEAAEMIMSHHTAPRGGQRVKQVRTEFVLDLAVACDLWWRIDVGSEPKHAREVEPVLREVGIKVYEVSGGWLKCEPRPAAIWEALTGRLAPADWMKQSNCPPEKPGHILKLLAERGIPVFDSELSLLEDDLQGGDDSDSVGGLESTS